MLPGAMTTKSSDTTQIMDVAARPIESIFLVHVEVAESGEQHEFDGGAVI